MKKLNKIFYDNEWRISSSNKYFKSNTFNSKKIFYYPECNKLDIQRTILSAKKGFQYNKNLNLIERKKFIFKIYNQIKKNYKKIAKVESLETGKNISDAEKEILHSANIWLFAFKSLKNNNSKLKLSKQHNGHIIYEPVGIVSLIIPWNFPFVVLSERLPFILGSGNSVIIKPSEFASQSMIYFMNLIKKTNLPIGIINLITGSGPKVGSYLTKNKNINMVSFTGSTKVGKKIIRSSSKNIKRLSLELGGKNSIIVLADADLDKTINILINSFTGNAGQSCVSTSRLLVDIKIKEKLIKKLINRLTKIKNFKKIYGFISTRFQYNFLKKSIQDNNRYNNNIIYGLENFKHKNFISPIIFKDLPQNHIFNKKELFGPILSINSFENENQAIKISNSTKYGLSAVICSRNKKKSFKIAERLNSGRIWINESVKINYPSLPIGGYKESGFNRESGTEGFRTYSEIKSIIYNKN